MVAIDSTYEANEVTPAGRTGAIVLFAFLGSAVLAAASLSVSATPVAGWHLATEMVSRFSLVIFVAAMIVEPIARLIPSAATRALGRARGSLILAFAAASAASLVCVVAPYELSGESLSLPAVAYSGFTAMILVVMLFSAHPSMMRNLGGPAGRAMQRIATTYFWVVFTIAGLEHLIGPHRPDNWYGFSMLLLVAAVLLRFTDTLVAHWRPVANMSEI